MGLNIFASHITTMQQPILTIVLLLCIVKNISAQKPYPDHNTLQSFSFPDDAAITTDGRFSFYTLNSKTSRSIIAQANNGAWKITLPDATDPVIAGCTHLIFKQQDSIGILHFPTHQLHYKKTTKPFKVTGSNRILAYFSTNDQLILHDLISNTSVTYPSVKDLVCSKDGKVAILVNENNDLQWLDLHTKKMFKIWSGKDQPHTITFNDTHTKIAFLTDDHICITGPDQQEIYSDKISFAYNMLSFSPDSKRIFFWTKQPQQTIPELSPDAVKIDIWHYQDKRLQTQQLSELHDEPAPVLSVYNIHDKKIIHLPLEERERYITGQGQDNYQSAHHILTVKTFNRTDEKQFDRTAGRSTVSIYSFIDGTKKTLLKDQFITNITLSPDEKFFVYYDQLQAEYISYEISTGNKYFITKEAPVSFCNDVFDNEKGMLSCPADFSVGWTDKGRSALLYDKFDIWKADLHGTGKPVNITAGYGRKNGVQLRNYRNEILKGTDTNYNTIFYRLSGSTPVKLSEGPFNYWIKEKTGDYYLVQRSDAAYAPNWFISKDLRTFQQITDIQPQQRYNWYTTELLRWQMPDGRWSQGILYKPENFDADEKYPLILHIYEKYSQDLHKYAAPQLSDGDLDPGWFASRGYIIFQPDIYYTYGHPGESAYNSVMSATAMLTQKTWIDSTKIGLYGVSMGAYEVNYLITHSTRFTAAVAACGQVNLISGYGGLRESGISRQYLYETGQTRIGASLWEKPDLYITNSPIFYADKVTTPLLIMHNKNDNAVPWGQGVEWFTALRRLGKKCWMLQYDDEEHGLSEEKNQLDYTKRLEQYFGHYLKEQTKPVWISTGVPARWKGIITGLETE